MVNKLELYSWGYNFYYQTGVESENAIVDTPNQVPISGYVVDPEKENIIDVEAGYHSTLCLSQNGNVYSIGVDYAQVLSVPTVLEFKSRTRIVSISSGSKHCAAINDGGQLYTWGCGFFGRLGHGNEMTYPNPLQVTSIKHYRIVSVACGGAHTLAIEDSGRIFSWGFNRYQQCGNSFQKSILTPESVTSLTSLREDKPKRAICGRHHSGVLTESGSLYTWGHGKYGRLGHPNCASIVSYPRLVADLDGIPLIDVAFGAEHSLALTIHGKLYSWGCGYDGRLGHGSELHFRTPWPVDQLGNVKIAQISAGPSHSSAISIQGRLFTWGAVNGGAGKIPNENQPDFNPYPEPMYVGIKFAKVACGGAHTCSLAVPNEANDNSFPIEQLYALHKQAFGEEKWQGPPRGFLIQPLRSDAWQESADGSTSRTSSTRSSFESKYSGTMNSTRSMHSAASRRGSMDGDFPLAPENVDQDRLFSWCRHNHVERIKALLLQGLNPNEKNENGHTLLHVAAQNNLLRMAKMLVYHGADINAQNYKGQTALHYCYKYKFDRLFRYLLKQGADDTLTNEFELTCYEGLNLTDLERFSN